MSALPPTAAETAHKVLTRDEIIRRLAAAYGHHKTWSPADRAYMPDGNDAEATTMITFTADDGGPALRCLTYGEIADALINAKNSGPEGPEQSVNAPR
jgi:hypothetical protein